MKLHHSFGMNPRAVRFFILEKGIEIEKVEVDILAAENREAGYLAKNPQGQLPLLELDDGTYIAETQAICEYLEDKNPGHPLIGTTPEERAVARMWWRRVELEICRPMVLGFYYAEGYDLFKTRVHCIPAAAEEMKTIGRERMQWLEGLLKPGQFIAGDRFSVADIFLYTYIDQLRTVGQPIPDDCTKLQAWFSSVDSRPAAEASVWPVQPMGMRG